MLCCATLYNDVVEVSERGAANFYPYPFGGCCYHRAGKYTYGFSVCNARQLAPGCCGDQGASPSYAPNPGCVGYHGHPGFPSTVALNPQNYDSEAVSGGMISWNRVLKR